MHTPVDAEVLGYDYLPGALWPVNPRVAARRNALLARNERVVFRMDAGPARQGRAGHGRCGWRRR